jgi:hypothetical protein
MAVRHGQKLRYISGIWDTTFENLSFECLHKPIQFKVPLSRWPGEWADNNYYGDVVVSPALSGTLELAK